MHEAMDILRLITANAPTMVHSALNEQKKMAHNPCTRILKLYNSDDKASGQSPLHSLSAFAPEWAGVQTIARTTSLMDINCKKTSSSSLENNATLIGKSVRQHWAIENSLHYVLDMTFREDDSRIRKGYAPANLAAIRRVAVSLLKARKPPNITNKRAMFKAAMCIDLANFLFAGI